jgi:hypothetical protein
MVLGISGRIFSIRLALLLACASLAVSGSPAASISEPGGDASGAQLAVQNPDEFAWQVFFFINHQAKAGTAGIADEAKASIREYDEDRDVVWETWALASREGTPEAEVFLIGGAKPVEWEQLPRAGNKAPKILDRTFTLLGEGRKSALPTRDLHAPFFVPGEPESDEVRMNRATFDFVRAQSLYSREGLVSAFRSATSNDSPDLISFPAAAKEVKARWQIIGEQQKGRYHWKSIGGRTWGLVAFHIITKDQPMWFWTDFIHEDFADAEPPGSFRDSTTRGPDAPHGRDGVRNETLGSKWENYRLKGSQLTFHDSRGNPIILGNEIIESGRAAISSCITCHAGAGVAENGDFSSLPFITGAPPPEYFSVSGNMLVLQTDFLYSLPLRAQAAGMAARPAPPEVPLAQAIRPGIRERIPPRIQERIIARTNAIREGLEIDRVERPFFHINRSKRWKPGGTVTISFYGGNRDLHQKIESTASEWTKYANLKLDFGRDPATGKYRTWSPRDNVYASNVRISFNQQGYYSCVGNDSDNPVIVSSGEESMNLEGFDRFLPDDWATVVLHEFGHALGFEHEHQHTDSCDFRWDDDPGYQKTFVDGQYGLDQQGRRPGIYTLLGGPPNNWSRATIDFNLRKMPPSRAFDSSEFDPESIMKYYFESWMFASGTESACYTTEQNDLLSTLDQAGARKVYPVQPEALTQATEALENSISILKKLETISSAEIKHLDAIIAPE